MSQTVICRTLKLKEIFASDEPFRKLSLMEEGSDLHRAPMKAVDLKLTRHFFLNGRCDFKAGYDYPTQNLLKDLFSLFICIPHILKILLLCLCLVLSQSTVTFYAKHCRAF